MEHIPWNFMDRLTSMMTFHGMLPSKVIECDIQANMWSRHHWKDEKLKIPYTWIGTIITTHYNHIGFCTEWPLQTTISTNGNVWISKEVTPIHSCGLIDRISASIMAWCPWCLAVTSHDLNLHLPMSMMLNVITDSIAKKRYDPSCT